VHCAVLDMVPPAGFDMVVIDRRHVILGPAPVGGRTFLGSALFEENSLIGEELAQWIDGVNRLYQPAPYP
jgi:hypothetical protein